jgi:hypothetical protein
MREHQEKPHQAFQSVRRRIAPKLAPVNDPREKNLANAGKSVEFRWL